MSSDYPLKNFTYPVKPTIDETNPHNLPLLPEDVFDPLFENLKKMAIGYLSKYDPSHADLYQSILPEADKLLNPQFKVQMREFFAGCFDKESPMFQQLCRNVVGKLGTYLRFAKEKEMYQEQLDKIQIKKPLFVLSLPRSGSTYVHTLLASDPKASAIRFYEHMQPGSHTMNSDSRKKLVSDVMNQVHNDANASELNIIHNMDDVMRFEEEMFFMEMLGQCFMMTCGLPRLEKYRSHLFDYDFHYVYDALLDEFKMHIEEFPLKENGYICLKAVNHFASIIPFFDVFGKKELESRIVWIHREPVDQIKSLIPLILATRSRFEHDLGLEDMDWLNKTAINITEILLKNAIATRDEWVKQDPEREKQILDIGFRDAVSRPKETVQHIYQYFGIDYTEDVDKSLIHTIEEGDPQKKHGRKARDTSLFRFNDDDIRERFKFYYERFSKYMPNYYPSK